MRVRPMRPEAPATVMRIALMEALSVELVEASNLGIDSVASAIGRRRGLTVCFGYRDHGRTQQTLPDGVPGLHDIHDRSRRRRCCGYLRNGLMQMRIEALTLGLDRFDAMAGESC